MNKNINYHFCLRTLKIDTNTFFKHKIKRSYPGLFHVGFYYPLVLTSKIIIKFQQVNYKSRTSSLIEIV